MARRRRWKTKFKTEAELCAEFLLSIDTVLWTAYNETAGWDILLVRKSDGFQIGIQAKLRVNLHVFNQALESASWYATDPGPDCRAILVPDGCGLGNVAHYLGITIIEVRGGGGNSWSHPSWSPPFYPELPLETPGGDATRWHELCPSKRCKLPDYVPDVPAGVKAPLQLTDWKVRALRIAIVLEDRGFVAREDFKHFRIDHRRWITPGSQWLLKNGTGGFVAGPFMPDFKKQHPKVWKQMWAERKDWMPKPKIVPVQGRLL